MQTLFPPALVACIAEGRRPGAAEFDELAEQVQLQAFGARPARTAKRLAEMVAEIAFNGTGLFR